MDDTTPKDVAAAGDANANDASTVIHQLEEELNEMGVKPLPAAGETAPIPAVPPMPDMATFDAAVTPVASAVPPAPAVPAMAPSSVSAPGSVPAAAVPAQSQVPAAAASQTAVPSRPEPVFGEPDPEMESTLTIDLPPGHLNTPEHHEVMGQVLMQAIQKGKDEVPTEPDPLVRRPGELESWRVFKIMAEFVEGFELLSKYGLAASFFGSARTTFAEHFYADATSLAGKLAKAGFATITGGSAGIMEAANKGAFEAGGASVGLNIRLSDSQGMNEYLTDSMTFEHFFVRKVMLTFASEVYVYFPGGFGTLDEFTEIITLVQTKKIRRIPIVLYGKEYWEPFTKVFEGKLDQEYHALDHSDLELYKVVDSVDEAYDYIVKATGGKDVR